MKRRAVDEFEDLQQWRWFSWVALLVNGASAASLINHGLQRHSELLDVLAVFNVGYLFYCFGRLAARHRDWSGAWLGLPWPFLLAGLITPEPGAGFKTTVAAVITAVSIGCSLWGRRKQAPQAT